MNARELRRLVSGLKKFKHINGWEMSSAELDTLTAVTKLVERVAGMPTDGMLAKANEAHDRRTSGVIPAPHRQIERASKFGTRSLKGICS